MFFENFPKHSITQKPINKEGKEKDKTSISYIFSDQSYLKNWFELTLILQINPIGVFDQEER